MKNTFGSSITVTLFGESHGEYIGAVLDGIAPGIKIDRDYINAKLEQRKPRGKISTARVEGDEFIIASGEFNGFTTGTPLTILIPNTNKKSVDYRISLLPPVRVMRISPQSANITDLRTVAAEDTSREE